MIFLLTCLIFVEDNIDKNKLYKKFDKMKFAVEFELPKEQELLVWIGRKFKKTIKTLTKGLLFT